MRLKKASFALLASAALVLGACSSADSGKGGADSKSLPGTDVNRVDRDKLAKGGNLRLAISSMPTNYNYMQFDGTTGDVSRLNTFIGVGNWIYAEDGTFKENKNYVESYKFDDKEDGAVKQTVTLKLNPKAKWNSGRAIDYTDYVATWDACNDEAVDPEKANPDAQFLCGSTDGWKEISSIEKGKDQFEVVVKYSKKYPDWSANLSGVYPAEGMKDAVTFNKGWTDLSKINNFYTGPFKVASVDNAKGVITLAKNENWWGEAPLLDTVTFSAMEVGAQATAFANKELDVVDMIVDAETYGLAKGRQDGDIKMSASVQWRHFTVNTKTGVLADKKMRQAIQKGINTDDIIASDLAGLPSAKMDMKLGNHFFMPNQKGYKDNSVKYDPEAAKKEIEDLGYKFNETTKYYEKDGKPLGFKYLRLPETPTSANEGASLQSQMKEIGVKVDFEDTTSKEFFTKIGKGEFETVAFTWQGTPYPMANIGQIYGPNSKMNYSGLNDPKIAEYITKVASETDPEKRIELTNEVDKIIWDNVMTIPIYYRATLTAVPKNLANYGATAFETFLPENIGYTK
ncbi:ABC transporter family substrate-binding protein [Arcanobacterium bovis]|uniref:ABC transporter family substrate-binding protein n=1 Tax=Arcanobacterium bovis TaxID=2529275 RepID=A0A4Q9V3G5_9ACTO|nr:ABC transporter family substrate-binding protein [Arcanobacterium bovis]TBW23662.1 ABC transporter family substrate-binding protein [Arcanobacterium bovis]